LRTRAARTTAPPASVVAAALTRAEPGPDRAEHHLEQAEQRDLRRGQRAAGDDEQHARQPELEEAEERQEEKISWRRREGKGEGQGEQARDRAAEHDRRKKVEPRAVLRSSTRLIAAAMGMSAAIAIPAKCFSSEKENIQAMPIIAAPAATQVRSVNASRRKTRARRAVSSGHTLITTSALAVVVSDSANMKAVNITAHINPDTSPGHPALRTADQGRVFLKSR
jgi:hypothetical protein